MKTFVLSGKLFKWEGPAAWYFLRTTTEQGEELRTSSKSRIGWGSLRVQVTVGKTMFTTSLFPTKYGHYLLPVKASVRKKEGLEDGSKVEATCVLL